MQELSLNVLDIAQNSIRAGASLTTIRVEEDIAANRLLISVEDNGCGMTEEQVRLVTDPFFTTRTTRKVGLGVPFFKMAAEMTGGSFSLDSTPGKGTRINAVFVLDSIDRMPLGDMCGTICVLIRMNPTLDFVYIRGRDQKRFTVDTRELRGILGDVPLDTPEVMDWIKDYITEQTAQLTQERMD